MSQCLSRPVRSNCLVQPWRLEQCHKFLCKVVDIFRSSPAKISKRGFHSTGVKRTGAHDHDEPYYLHAKHMYNLDRMKHQKLKMSLGVFSAVSIGVVVPVYAVIFQQRKTASA